MYDYVAARVYLFYDTTIDKVNTRSYGKLFGFCLTDLIWTKKLSSHFSIVDVIRFCVGNYTTQSSANQAENLVDRTRRLVCCDIRSDTTDIVKIPPFEPNPLVGDFICSQRNELSRLIVSSLPGIHPSTIFTRNSEYLPQRILIFFPFPNSPIPILPLPSINLTLLDFLPFPFENYFLFSHPISSLKAPLFSLYTLSSASPDGHLAVPDSLQGSSWTLHNASSRLPTLHHDSSRFFTLHHASTTLQSDPSLLSSDVDRAIFSTSLPIGPVTLNAADQEEGSVSSSIKLKQHGSTNTQQEGRSLLDWIGMIIWSL